MIKNLESISSLVIGNEEFSVVRFTWEGKRKFGTVPKEFIKDGKLTKTLNGLHLAIADTMEECLENRRDCLKARKTLIKLGLINEEGER